MILASSGRVWPHYAIFMHLQSLQKFSPPSIDIAYAGMLCVISPILCKEKASRQPGNRIPIFCSCKTCKFAKFDNALCIRRIHNGTRVILEYRGEVSADLLSRFYN